jgi:hypothetical protein
MKGFFGYKKSKMSAGVRPMVDALYSLAIKFLDNPALFHHQMASYAQIVNATKMVPSDTRVGLLIIRS